MESTATSEHKITWATIRDHLQDLMYQLSSMKFKVGLCRTNVNKHINAQDPVQDGEDKIKKDFDELHEAMQTSFRNMED